MREPCILGTLAPTRQSSSLGFKEPFGTQSRQQQRKPQSAGVASTRTPTPYERKRTQQVVEMNKKVEANMVQQIHEATHLKAFKMSVLEQELEISEETAK